METLKYTIIKSEQQYNMYCDVVEALLADEKNAAPDEIELLNLLIEKWDKEQNSFDGLDPIELIKTLMEERNMKPKDLTEILGLSKGTVSKILNYRKGLSKETIRKLSDHFKVLQEAFNRPYRLINEANRHFRDTGLMNTKKDLRKKVMV
jgi:HTH-type transcriptional regulator/antitoxin HigA